MLLGKASIKKKPLCADMSTHVTDYSVKNWCFFQLLMDEYQNGLKHMILTNYNFTIN